MSWVRQWLGSGGRVKAWLSLWLGVSVLCALPTMTLGAAPRLVVADGTLTEIIYALGAEEALVGVDTTSTYPPLATQLPQVGYLRQLGAEGILSLRPQRLLVSEDAGPAAVLTRLKAAGVSVTVIKAAPTVAGTGQRIREVGAAVGAPAAAAELAQRTEAGARRALASIPAGPPPRVLFLMDAGSRGVQAAGAETRADALLQLVGAENVLTAPGYRPLNAEAVLTRKPDWILVGQVQAQSEPQLPAGLVAAAKAMGVEIHSVELARTLSFGPRLPAVLVELVQLLYSTADAS